MLNKDIEILIKRLEKREDSEVYVQFLKQVVSLLLEIGSKRFETATLNREIRLNRLSVCLRWHKDNLLNEK